MILALQQQLSMDSYISIAVLLAVAGGIWKIASILTDIKLQMQEFRLQLQTLKHTPARLAHIEEHLLMFEEDVNNLFGAVRASAEPEKLADFTRRARYRPFRAPEVS